jgi:hypothetical protein
VLSQQPIRDRKPNLLVQFTDYGGLLILERPGDVRLFDGNLTGDCESQLIVIVRYIPGRSIGRFRVQKDAHIVEIQQWVKLEWEEPKQPLYILVCPQAIGDAEERFIALSEMC